MQYAQVLKNFLRSLCAVKKMCIAIYYGMIYKSSSQLAAVLNAHKYLRSFVLTNVLWILSRCVATSWSLQWRPSRTSSSASLRAAWPLAPTAAAPPVWPPTAHPPIKWAAACCPPPRPRAHSQSWMRRSVQSMTCSMPSAPSHPTLIKQKLWLRMNASSDLRQSHQMRQRWFMQPGPISVLLSVVYQIRWPWSFHTWASWASSFFTHWGLTPQERGCQWW